MNPNVQAFWDKAERAMDAASLLINAKDAEGAVNRAYYAAFYAATAALLAEGESAKTHTGVHNRFRVRFIQSGRLDETIGKVLPLAYHLRQQADYDAATSFEVKAVLDLLVDIAAFIQAVRTMTTP